MDPKHRDRLAFVLKLFPEFLEEILLTYTFAMG